MPKCNFINLSFCHTVILSVKHQYYDKSAVSSTALVMFIFWYVYLVKTHKLTNNLTTTEARVKINTDLESLEIRKYFTEFKNNQILLFKFSHPFMVTAKLYPA